MELQLKLSYKMMKKMKKLYGKNQAYEIALGRKLIKMMKEKYAT